VREEADRVGDPDGKPEYGRVGLGRRGGHVPHDRQITCKDLQSLARLTPRTRRSPVHPPLGQSIQPPVPPRRRPRLRRLRSPALGRGAPALVTRPRRHGHRQDVVKRGFRRSVETPGASPWP
jgi:hypothetical protein